MEKMTDPIFELVCNALKPLEGDYPPIEELKAVTDECDLNFRHIDDIPSRSVIGRDFDRFGVVLMMPWTRNSTGSGDMC